MPPLTLRTFLFLRDLPGGSTLAFPIAEPRFASFGSEDDALYEQRFFLSAHLARSSPEVIARHALPAATALRTVRVLLPREDLPRRLAIQTPIDLPAVVVPTPPNTRGFRDAWVFVPPLGMTLYVPAGEDLETAVAAEVKRAVFAQELSPLDYLRLLPGDGDRLEPIEVTVAEEGEGTRGGVAAARQAIAEREAKKAAAEVLDSVATRMDPRPEQERRPLVGRDRELALFASILGGEERLSAVVAGEERVGKTALLAAWIDRQSDAGRGRPVYATSGAQWIAGMSGFGQWQERARRILEAAERLDAVLFFDDLGDLLADRSTGGVDLPGFLKPYLEDGRVRLVGELKADQVERAAALHVGFFASLSRVRVGPMSAAESDAVLRAHLAFAAQREPHRPQVTGDAVAPILDLAERYLPYEAFPGKAVRLYDELRATDRPRGPGGIPPRLGAREVIDWFSLRTGVPAFLLRDEETRSVTEVTAHLARRLVGQGEAVRRVAETVCVVKAGVQPKDKPLATFLFVGPTGVGKTELARALAELLFGAADRLVRFDMSEYEDAYAADRLFRGNDGGEGLLTRQVREQPFSVVLLDEIEKAHPAVFDLLLQVCGEGRLTDGRGRTAYFHNSIVILTSNLGAAHRRPALGFDPAAPDDEAHYRKAVTETFRAELVNRLDRIVVFRALTPEEARHIVRLAVNKVAGRTGLAGAGVELRVDEDVLDRLAEAGFSSAYGARALRRHIDEVLVAPVARLLSSGGVAKNAVVTVRRAEAPVPPGERPDAQAEAFGLRFAFASRAASSAAEARGERAVREVSRVRRELHRQLRFNRVVQLKDQVASLVAQLGHGQSTRKKERRIDGATMAAMQSEHHRLSALTTALDSAFAEVCGLEELAMDALFRGEPVDAFVPEASAARDRFRAALVRALVADEPHRDEATLLLQEIGSSGRALDLWLAPLLHALPARQWQATLHVHGDRNPDPARWPEDRKWGPPRSPEWALTELARADRSASAWLLCIRGPYAGILLSLEGGLHRIAASLRADDPPGLLLATLLARKATFSDVEWTLPSLVPQPPPGAHEVKPGNLARDYDARQELLTLFSRRGAVPLVHADYWPRFETIALEHLLVFEEGGLTDRDTALAPRLKDGWHEVRALLRKGDTIGAIKLYRQRAGVGLREAREAIEAMAAEQEDS